MKPRLAIAFFSIIIACIATSARAQSGADLYKSKCASCHGADGLGSTPAGKSMKVTPFNSPELVKKSDDELISATTDGKGKMPAYKGKLTAPQIKDIIAHIRTLQK